MGAHDELAGGATEIGPVQILTVAFEGNRFRGEILPELADGHAFDEQDEWALIEAIEPGTSAAIALIEHVWAKPLRAAIARADGIEIANDWLRPDDLIAVGMSMAAEADGAPDEAEE